jgi:hypothetical protein
MELTSFSVTDTTEINLISISSSDQEKKIIQIIVTNNNTEISDISFYFSPQGNKENIIDSSINAGETKQLFNENRYLILEPDSILSSKSSVNNVTINIVSE